jgi:hypothetical protein
VPTRRQHLAQYSVVAQVIKADAGCAVRKRNSYDPGVAVVAATALAGRTAIGPFAVVWLQAASDSAATTAIRRRRDACMITSLSMRHTD